MVSIVERSYRTPNLDETRMDPFEYSLRNAKCDVASLVAWTQLSDHKYARLVLEKLTNFVGAQVP